MRTFKNLFLSLIGIFFLSILILCFKVDVHAANPIPNGWYLIASGNNPRFVLDISGASQNDGGNLLLWEKTNSYNQRFYLEYKNGYYYIRARHSGKYLHVQDGKTQVNVHQWTGYNHDNARWILRDAGNGYYYIVNKRGGYLDNCGGTARNGNNVWTYSGNGFSAQKWKFLSTTNGSDEKRTISDGWYTIRSKNNHNLVFDVEGANTGNGANLQLWTLASANKNQKFYLRYLGNGYYSIRTGHSGKYLHKQNSGTTENVVQWEGCNINGVQVQWSIINANDGYYYIRSKAGNVIDNSGGNARNGNNIITYNYNGTDAQKWKFVPTSSSGTNYYSPGKPSIKSLTVCTLSDVQRNADAFFYLMRNNKIPDYSVTDANQHTLSRDSLTKSYLDRFLDYAFSGSNDSDLNIFYFTGHSTVNQNHNPLGLSLGNGTYYDYEELANKLNRYNGKMLVILDTCHAEAFIRKGINKLSDKSHIYALCSCAYNEQSTFASNVTYQNLTYSAYTYTLGSAMGFFYWWDAKSGKLSFDDLQRYVSNNIGKRNKKMTPKYYKPNNDQLYIYQK